MRPRSSGGVLIVSTALMAGKMPAKVRPPMKRQTANGTSVSGIAWIMPKQAVPASAV